MDLKTSLFSLGCFFLIGSLLSLAAQETEVSQHVPVVVGKAIERFEVGRLLFEDDFDDLSRWQVQIEDRDGFPDAKVQATQQTLDCLLPGRGCTIWFREKLKTRTVITYDVVCPQPEKNVKGVEPKDINNFWLASDPIDPENGLFDSDHYNGSFPTYNRMNGYYASTGGGRNTTTRFRRYPREKDESPLPHIALKDHDGDQAFMIEPAKRDAVQLVAFDDLVQYIVDGELVYEVAFEDDVTVEQNENGKRKDVSEIYNATKYPFYKEGYFGFRMVGTHHIYSAFRVHELKPIATEAQEKSE